MNGVYFLAIRKRCAVGDGGAGGLGGNAAVVVELDGDGCRE